MNDLFRKIPSLVMMRKVSILLKNSKVRILRSMHFDKLNGVMQEKKGNLGQKFLISLRSSDPRDSHSLDLTDQINLSGFDELF